MASVKQVQAAVQQAVLSAVSSIVLGSIETVTIGGSPTTGDVLTLTLASPQFGATQTINVSYTVLAGDATLNIVQGLARAVNINSTLQATGLRALASTSSTLLQVFYPTGVQIAWTSAVAGLSPTETITLAGAPLQPQVAIGWPSVGALQEVARGGCLVTIYDAKRGRDTTRWNPYPFNPTRVTPILTATPSTNVMLAGLGSRSFVLGGGTIVATGDAIAAVITNVATSNPAGTALGVVVSAAQGDTPAIMAAKLQTAINADPVASTWVSASVVGSTLTVTNLLATPIMCQLNIGNGGTRTLELGRRERALQIVVWTRTENDRESVIEPIAQMLASQQVNYGPTLADGTYIRLEYVNDVDIEMSTLADVYRHDFLCTIDYPVTVLDQLYAVLAPVDAFTLF